MNYKYQLVWLVAFLSMFAGICFGAQKQVAVKDDAALQSQADVLAIALSEKPEYQELFEVFIDIQIILASKSPVKKLRPVVKKLIKQVEFIQKYSDDPLLDEVLTWCYAQKGCGKRVLAAWHKALIAIAAVAVVAGVIGGSIWATRPGRPWMYKRRVNSVLRHMTEYHFLYSPSSYQNSWYQRDTVGGQSVYVIKRRSVLMQRVDALSRNYGLDANDVWRHYAAFQGVLYELETEEEETQRLAEEAAAREAEAKRAREAEAKRAREAEAKRAREAEAKRVFGGTRRDAESVLNEEVFRAAAALGIELEDLRYHGYSVLYKAYKRLKAISLDRPEAKDETGKLILLAAKIQELPSTLNEFLRKLCASEPSKAIKGARLVRQLRFHVRVANLPGELNAFGKEVEEVFKLINDDDMKDIGDKFFSVLPVR